METANILDAYSRTAPELSRSADRLEVRSEGGRILLYTGEGTVRQSRNYARGVGALAVAGGIALLWFSIWGLIVIAFGLVVVVVVPRTIRATKLVEIDTEGNQFIVVQSTVGAGSTLSLERIQSIRGAYDTKGWDGFSVVYAVGDDGSETPILMLLGTDERLAEIACRTLGVLLDRPAAYAGPFGSFSVCFTPEQSGS